MVPNSAGGYAFAVDDWTRLERFLILGTEGGLVLRDRAGADDRERAGGRPLPGGRRRRGRSARSSQVSDSGRAPKNEPAVLALAIAAGMGHTAAASEALPKVCRTGTHLFAFAEAVQGLRGWGRALRKGVAAWYEGKAPDALAYQVAKYQRARRLVAPRPAAPGAPGHGRPGPAGGLPLGRRRAARPSGRARSSGARRSRRTPTSRRSLPRLLAAMDEARTADRATVIRLIREDGLPRECIPTGAPERPRRSGRRCWRACRSMAMVRNLAKMTAVGLLTPGLEATKTVRDRLARRRAHPQVAAAPAGDPARRGHVLRRGRGLKGSLSWEPVATVKRRARRRLLHGLRQRRRRRASGR